MSPRPALPLNAAHLPAQLVLPFNALCSEKAAHLQKLLAPAQLTVKSFFGGQGERTIISPETGTFAAHMIVATAFLAPTDVTHQPSLKHLALAQGKIGLMATLPPSLV